MNIRVHKNNKCYAIIKAYKKEEKFKTTENLASYEIRYSLLAPNNELDNEDEVKLPQ